jgi:hypothetical protein
MVTNRYTEDWQKLTKTSTELWVDVILEKSDILVGLLSSKDAFLLGLYVGQAELFYKVRQALSRNEVTPYNTQMDAIATANELHFFGTSYNTIELIEAEINDYLNRRYPIITTETN